MNVIGLEALFSCKGYRVSYGRTDGEIMQVNLETDKRYRLKCPQCNSKMSLNRINYSVVRDLPFSEIKSVFIKYPIRQMRCRRCGKTHSFKPEIIATRARATKRLLRYTAAFCQYMPATKVAQYFNVSDGTVRSWNQTYLKAELGEPNLDNLRYLLVDEKSIGRGHSYITIVLNALNGGLLHMAEGKKKESLKLFIDKLDETQKAGIGAVCVDRSGAYTKCIEEFLPKAKITYDKFHLVQNLNAVIDKIRRALWNQAREQDDIVSANLIKGQRYNLLRNKSNNTEHQQHRLDELLSVNAPLSEAYLLLDSFKHTLSITNTLLTEDQLAQWISMAKNSCRSEMVKFAKNLNSVTDKVVNAVRFNLNNGRIESFNRKIAMVIRRACGCRNLNYLFLNLRQLAREPIPL